MIASALGGGRIRATGARPTVSRAVLFLEALCVTLWLAQELFMNRSIYATVNHHPEPMGQRELEAPGCYKEQESMNGTAPARRVLSPASPTSAPSSLHSTVQPTTKAPLSNAASSTISLSSLPQKPRLFWCGYEDMGNIAAATLFPDFGYPGSYTYRCLGPKRTIQAQPYDVIVYGMHGKCFDFRDNIPGLLNVFPGKILFINGESFGNIQTMNPTSSERLYQLGPYREQQAWQHHSFQVYFLVIRFFKLSKEQQRSITDHRYKPHGNSPKEHPTTVAYFVSNCVDFRQQAAAEIGEIIPLHHTKGCHVNASKAELVPSPKLMSMGARGAYENHELYQNYKYCLVMENKVYPGYITEKILNSYLGGCVPIYYGTKEIFDIFHKDSFVFYNVTNPQPALEQLQMLENDPNAYQKMLYDTPILASPEVLEKYFSLSDDVGGGRLKKQIREMMGIEGTWEQKE
ncbi:Glycosyltransferase family 10 (fucosyltransferase) [Seminavis robusta]|uniref:Fucosyltransferase n=1 Tax=Seminavis robusta TaxID=568900 RepID=A0A9N8EV18_9STRA|nr:Glycosyltransferase family 10 (fucosyltransferase) [Seminavis robusta]|eukprot:Sro1962_g308120.1 Glycosyltransferase family 10 (fucosyltransferase) (460) ;mRNA; f:9810-11189